MRRLLGLLALLPLMLVTIPAPAHASCAEDSGAEGSPVVFVGTVQEERRGFTRFEVEEVWAGPDLADQVWVLSGQEQPPFPFSMFSAVASSNDAEFADGERYVVGASEDFGTGACRISGAADLGAQQPADAREPVADGSSGADPPVGTLGIGLTTVGGLVLLAAAVSAVRWRRRRRAG